MFCPKCGTENANNSANCSNCGEILNPQATAPVATPVAAAAPAASIPNYMVQSILLLVASILCCWTTLAFPFSIVAVVFASQVNGKVAAGDIAGAKAASGNAKLWCWITFGIFAVVALIELIFVALYGIAALAIIGSN